MCTLQDKIKLELSERQKSLAQAMGKQSLTLEEIIEKAKIDQMVFNRSQIRHRPCMLDPNRATSENEHLYSIIQPVCGDLEIADILDMDIESDGEL